MTVEDPIYIEAPPDVVWAVTEDVERWPEWTPTVTSVVRVDDGPFGLGSAARIKQPRQPESEWTVTEFVPGERFVWGTQRPGLRMRASHEVEADGAGTANVLRVEVTGVAAVLLWPVLRRAVGWALSEENRGLKARCEELSGLEARP
jgi:uncharacterized membrane protein